MVGMLTFHHDIFMNNEQRENGTIDLLGVFCL
jgi:hypothetical protein